MFIIDNLERAAVNTFISCNFMPVILYLCVNWRKAH